MQSMIDDYSLDGVILHSDRSCKPYSLGQMDQRERLTGSLKRPALLLEADHNDMRCYADEQAATRLAAFAEMLEALLGLDKVQLLLSPELNSPNMAI